MKRKFILKIAMTILVIFVSVVSPVLSMTYSYDDLGRLISITDDSGQNTTYSYDSAGNMLSTTNSLGNKMITAYSLTVQTGPTTINNKNHKLDMNVHSGTDVTKMVASFTLSDGASAQIGSVTQVSGTTANDFTNPVLYKVTAPDGSEQDWTVTVTVVVPTAPITEVLTVSNPATTGFAVSLSPALNGLQPNDFIFLDDQSQPVNITTAITTNSGITYTISATLTAGKTYTITATKTGFDFGTAQAVFESLPVNNGGGSSYTPAPTLPSTPNPTVSSVLRLSGQNRVDTALAIGKANYPGKVANVFLTAADNFPDALAGSVLAYKLNAPILLTGSSDVDQVKVLDYMKSNLNPTGTVYILGGTAVVSSAMEGKVIASGFTNITRLGGADRYDTCVKIANQLKVRTGTPIVLAYGENYPDALSISSIAAAMQYPIILVQKDRLSDLVKNEIATLKPTKVYIIGGEGVISATVENQVAQITSLDKANIARIAGADRYETSLAVAQYFNLSGQSVCVATGNNFPDALAGSVLAANRNAPIILADGRLSDQVMSYLKGRTLTGATIFGGEAVVSKDIEQQLSQLIGK